MFFLFDFENSKQMSDICYIKCEVLQSSFLWLILIKNESKLLKRAAFNLPLILLTVSHQEKHTIKVRSDAEKMLHNTRDVCSMFNSSKTISNKWWASLIKQAELLLKHSLQVLHTHVSLRCKWQSSLLSGSRAPPLAKNVTATWGEVAQSESSVLHWFCLYANDSMSDNLQSQLMPFKPADRMTTFISETFNVSCFTHNLQSATEERTQVLLSFSLFMHR